MTIALSAPAGACRRPAILLRTAAVAGCAGVALAFAGEAKAQFAPGGPPPAIPAATLGAGSSQFEIGSNFLQRLSREATYGFLRRDDAAGGGAPAASAAPLYRTWTETYGTAAETDARPGYVGDRRRTAGIVGGIGATLAPGFTVGVSVDQSRTWIDLPAARQDAGLDLTQLGVNAAYSLGPWTFGVAAVHGFASIDATRLTMAGVARSGYGGSVDGVLAEMNYSFTFGEARIVPKVALEYVTAQTDAFSEAGGFDPAHVAAVRGERARLLAGAEVGRYWIVGGQAIDLSAYGKLVDNFSQNPGTALVSGTGGAITVQGIRESTLGADAGAAASYILSRTTRLYAAYDGRFRDNYRSHQGTLGLELKW